jgi:copper(I)-binding protein
VRPTIGSTRFNRRLVLVTLGVMAILVGCTSGDDGTASMALADPWTRPTAPGAESTAMYLTVTNGTDTEDRLVGAASPQCAMVELHRSVDNDGVMSMRPAQADELTVAAGAQLRLEPGGLHLMCMGLTEPVADGDSVDFTLVFEQAGEIYAAAQAESR